MLPARLERADLVPMGSLVHETIARHRGTTARHRGGRGERGVEKLPGLELKSGSGGAVGGHARRHGLVVGEPNTKYHGLQRVPSTAGLGQ